MSLRSATSLRRANCQEEAALNGAAPPAAVAASSEGCLEYAVATLRPCPLNPRQDHDPAELERLAASIRANGIIEPLVVRKVTGKAGLPIWEVVAGSRRLEAAKRVGLLKVPVVLRRDLSDRGALELILIENCQRTDLNPIERALAYRRLLDEFGLTQQELGLRIGVPAPSISDSVRLLRLPKPAQQKIIDGHLSATAGCILARVEDPEAFARLLRDATDGATAYTIRGRARAYTEPRDRPQSAWTLTTALDDLQLAIEQAQEAGWEPASDFLNTAGDHVSCILQVANYFRRHAGVPLNRAKRKLPQRWLDARAAVERGAAVKDIAAEHGITPEAVNYWLRKVADELGPMTKRAAP